MTDTSTNPREQIGGNQPDHAKIVMDRLANEYAELQRSVADGLEAARALPERVDNDDHQGEFAAVIKRLRDLNARLEGLRIAEKEPFLRSGNAVDSWFGTLKSKLFREKKTDKAGAADILQARVNDYVQRKADEERRRREEEARKAREEEDRLRREREASDALRREEEARAARARKPENEETALANAAAAEAESRRLRDEEERARSIRQDAEAAATTRTADLVRTRTEGGHMVTARQVPYVEITDEMQLNAAALWPFVKSDAKLAALKAWCKVTQHKQQMPGVVIEMRDEAVIR